MAENQPFVDSSKETPPQEIQEVTPIVIEVGNEATSTNMPQAVERWFSYGLNVLPTKDKKPLVHSWKEWQYRRQTREIVESMPWQSANGFAVICGSELTVNNKKVYFGAFDFDQPLRDINFNGYITEVETCVEFNPKHNELTHKDYENFHVYYFSQTPIDNKKFSLGNSNFELKGSGSYICIYGRDFNSLPIQTVNSLNTVYGDLAVELGYNRTKTMTNLKPKTKSALKVELDTLMHTITEEGNRDNRAFELSKIMRDLGYTPEQTVAELSDWNNNFCQPPLDANVLEAKVQSAFSRDPRALRFDRVQERDQIFNELIQSRHFITLTNDDIYLYRNGIYEQNKVKQLIRETTEARFQENYSESDTEQIMSRIRARTTFDNNAPENQIPDNLLCVTNGILDMDTLELKQHNPDYKFFNKIDIEYNPEAKCPNITQAMLQWLTPDGKQNNQYFGMQELFGYVLDRNYKYQYGFFLLGETGSNGKGKCVDLLKTFVGMENTSVLTLTQVQERFNKVNLYNKLLNISDELNKEALEDTTFFKMMTGESWISGEKKNVQEPVIFLNHAKAVILANQLPPVRDKTSAFFRRPILFEFNNRFTTENGKKDPDLMAKLITPEELSGLLNWALEGRKRLHENKEFSNQPTNEEEIQQRWISDPTRDLLEENFIETSSDNKIRLDEIVQYLEKKLREQGSTLELTNQMVGIKIQELFGNSKSKQVSMDNKRVRYILGIKRKDTPNNQSGQQALG
jgi:P4 family phage/plasmid primase-like protien